MDKVTQNKALLKDIEARIDSIIAELQQLEQEDFEYADGYFSLQILLTCDASDDDIRMSQFIVGNFHNTMEMSKLAAVTLLNHMAGQ